MPSTLRQPETAPEQERAQDRRQPPQPRSEEAVVRLGHKQGPRPSLGASPWPCSQGSGFPQKQEVREGDTAAWLLGSMEDGLGSSFSPAHCSAPCHAARQARPLLHSTDLGSLATALAVSACSLPLGPLPAPRHFGWPWPCLQPGSPRGPDVGTRSLVYSAGPLSPRPGSWVRRVLGAQGEPRPHVCQAELHR